MTTLRVINQQEFDNLEVYNAFADAIYDLEYDFTNEEGANINTYLANVLEAIDLLATSPSFTNNRIIDDMRRDFTSSNPQIAWLTVWYNYLVSKELKLDGGRQPEALEIVRSTRSYLKNFIHGNGADLPEEKLAEIGRDQDAAVLRLYLDIQESLIKYRGSFLRIPQSIFEEISNRHPDALDEMVDAHFAASPEGTIHELQGFYREFDNSPIFRYDLRYMLLRCCIDSYNFDTTCDYIRPHLPYISNLPGYDLEPNGEALRYLAEGVDYVDAYGGMGALIRHAPANLGQRDYFRDFKMRWIHDAAAIIRWLMDVNLCGEAVFIFVTLQSVTYAEEEEALTNNEEEIRNRYVQEYARTGIITDEMIAFEQSIRPNMEPARIYGWYDFIISQPTRPEPVTPMPYYEDYQDEIIPRRDITQHYIHSGAIPKNRGDKNPFSSKVPKSIGLIDTKINSEYYPSEELYTEAVKQVKKRLLQGGWRGVNSDYLERLFGSDRAGMPILNMGELVSKIYMEYFEEQTNSEITAAAKQELEKFFYDHGYEWNNYFAFVKSSHPFWLLLKGKVDLTPETFEFYVGPSDVYGGEVALNAISKTNQISTILTQVDYCGKKLNKVRKSGYSRNSLINAIHAAGLQIAGRSDLLEELSTKPKLAIQDYYSIVGKALSLERLTGNPDHRGFPIPGIGIRAPGWEKVYNKKTLSTEGMDILKWAITNNKRWLFVVYRYLYGTLGYVSSSNICKFGLTLPQLRRTGEYLYSINSAGMDRHKLCHAIEEESNRRMRVKQEILNSITQVRSITLIMSPGSVWLRDAIGDYTGFYEGSNGNFIPLPESIIPKRLEGMYAMYKQVCKMGRPQDASVLYLILQKLGLENMIPEQLENLSMRDMCSILDRAFRIKMIERSETELNPADFNKAYGKYIEMCNQSQRERHDLYEYIAILNDLGLAGMFGDALPDKDEACYAITKYIQTLKQSYTKREVLPHEIPLQYMPYFHICGNIDYYNMDEIVRLVEAINEQLTEDGYNFQINYEANAPKDFICRTIDKVLQKVRYATS